jgi:hypothetical protein
MSAGLFPQMLGPKGGSMEILWTTVSYAVVASGLALAGYIVARWFASARR